MIKFVIPGKMVSGKNQIGLRVVGSKIHKYPNMRFENWRDKAALQLRQQRAKLDLRWPLREPLHLAADYYPGDKIRRDATGMLDALFHLIERIQIVEDDSLIKRLTWIEHGLDRENPRVVLGLEPIPPRSVNDTTELERDSGLHAEGAG